MYKKKILFLTGTRADYGKLKPLINAVKEDKNFSPLILATGMHMLKKYGNTYTEIIKDFKNVKLYKFINQKKNDSMDIVLSNTIKKLNFYLSKINPDLVIVHGDRIETLAASIYCNLHNILLVHVEGGEVSGTIDECIRHATTKLSHLHFVANQKAKKVIRRLGELDKNIYVIGSPEVDTMIKKDLPSLIDTKKRYDIKFNNYAIFLFHPVTTQKRIETLRQCKILFSAIKKSKNNYIIIYPNNDTYSDIIFNFIQKLKNDKKFKILPTIRFEYYLTLLKNSEFIIGNSSSGVREAPVYGIKSINLGNRQNNRIAKSSLIKNLNFDQKKILNEINKLKNHNTIKSYNFGKGNSASKFINILKKRKFWLTDRQKYFS
tara:strand:+ start:1469 stop:2596 length:1128 start_codon:yes stop_codon:yes gene_type:complete